MTVDILDFSRCYGEAFSLLPISMLDADFLIHTLYNVKETSLYFYFYVSFYRECVLKRTSTAQFHSV